MKGAVALKENDWILFSAFVAHFIALLTFYLVIFSKKHSS